MTDAPTAELDTATDTIDTAAETVTWRADLSDDIQDNATLAKYDDINALASAHINLQRHLGAEKIVKPQTEDDWQDVYNFLGRPEDASAYEVQIADELPDQVKAAFDENSMAAFKDEAFKLGLNSTQVQGMVNFYAGNLGSQFEAMNTSQAESLESGEQALHQEWGRAYDQNIDFAKKAFAEYGGDDLAAVMESSGLGNNPAVLKAFANIAKVTMSDKDLAGPTNGGQVALTPQEAKDQASTIMSNPAYTDRHHPEHTKLVKQVQGLFEQAYA